MPFRTIFAALAVAVAMLMSSFAVAGDIQVSSPWARASAGPAKAGAAFLSIKNSGSADDRLIAARADVSDRAELHTHIMEGNLMKMRQVDGIDVPAGQTVALQPGGLHVMFLGLHAPFKQGEHFPLTLVFEKAGDIAVDVEIQGVAAKGLMEHQSGHKDMKNMKMDMKKTQ